MARLLLLSVGMRIQRRGIPLVLSLVCLAFGSRSAYADPIAPSNGTHGAGIGLVAAGGAVLVSGASLTVAGQLSSIDAPPGTGDAKKGAGGALIAVGIATVLGGALLATSGSEGRQKSMTRFLPSDSVADATSHEATGASWVTLPQASSAPIFAYRF